MFCGHNFSAAAGLFFFCICLSFTKWKPLTSLNICNIYSPICQFLNKILTSFISCRYALLSTPNFASSLVFHHYVAIFLPWTSSRVSNQYFNNPPDSCSPPNRTVFPRLKEIDGWPRSFVYLRLRLTLTRWYTPNFRESDIQLQGISFY